MTKTYPRLTLKNSVRLGGLGLHSGDPVKVSIHPGEGGRWLYNGSQKARISPEAVTDTSRCTRVGDVSTVEHVLSALNGLGITDAEIEVQGGELPAVGGCSLGYADAFQKVGLEPCGTLEIAGPFEREFVVVGDAQISASLGSGVWRIEFILEKYFTQAQSYEFVWGETDYIQEVSQARTVVLEEEMEAVKALGLGKGLDESSCLAIGFKEYLNPALYTDEPVRHKMLDLIGDLALTDIPLQHLNVVSEKGGHRANVEAAKRLADSTKVIFHS